mgnify:FL=1
MKMDALYDGINAGNDDAMTELIDAVYAKITTDRGNIDGFKLWMNNGNYSDRPSIESIAAEWDSLYDETNGDPDWHKV